MEGNDHEVHEMISVSAGVGGNTPATSRWNPTKEQITMLENLYRQGIRTPTAEQIQEITGRLQAYGHIEGKNVFYWFQNHKARQRQKQKQENNNFAYNFHRYFHHQAVPVPPLFPAPHHPPCPNVVCNPYYMPQPDLGFYPHHQYPKVLLPPTAIKKRLPRPDQLDHPRSTPNGYTEGGAYNDSFVSHANGYKRNIEDQLVNWKNNHSVDHHREVHHDHQETLELFPMHPTGILQARSSTYCQSYSNISTPSSCPETTTASTATNMCMMNNVEEGSAGTTTDQLYFDFLSGN